MIIHRNAIRRLRRPLVFLNKFRHFLIMYTCIYIRDVAPSCWKMYIRFPRGTNFDSLGGVRHQGKEFHVIDGVHFRFFGVDIHVCPCLSLSTHTRGNHNFLWKSRSLDYIMSLPGATSGLYTALQFLTSCFVFYAMGRLVKLQSYYLPWMKTTWCSNTVRNFDQ
jgi:hypothetical protein